MHFEVMAGTVTVPSVTLSQLVEGGCTLQVMQEDEVISGSGTEGWHIRIRTADLLLASRGRTVDFALRSAPSPPPPSAISSPYLVQEG